MTWRYSYQFVGFTFIDKRFVHVAGNI